MSWVLRFLAAVLLLALHSWPLSSPSCLASAAMPPPPEFFSSFGGNGGSGGGRRRGDEDDASYYKALGPDINRHSSPDEIKKAYRRRAMQIHPDKGGDTEVKSFLFGLQTLASRFTVHGPRFLRRRSST